MGSVLSQFYYEYVDTVQLASEETLLQDVLKAPVSAKQKMIQNLENERAARNQIEEEPEYNGDSDDDKISEKEKREFTSKVTDDDEISD